MRILSILFLSVFATSICYASEPIPVTYQEWRFPIALNKDSTSELKKVADEVSGHLGQKIVLLVDANPICCLWLELDSWKPQPCQDYYILHFEKGGAYIKATSIEQMKLAVVRLKEIVKRKDGTVSVPIGMVTNLPIIQSESRGVTDDKSEMKELNPKP